MRFFKIHPDVNCVNSNKGTLEDKGRAYSEDHWNEGDADEYVQTGFLVEAQSENTNNKSALKEFKK